MAFLRDEYRRGFAPQQVQQESDYPSGTEVALKTTGMLGSTAFSLYKGVEKYNQKALGELGYLDSPNFMTEKGKQMFTLDPGKDMAWWKKPFRGPEERVKLTKAGKDHFAELASRNPDSNIVNEYMTHMEAEGIAPADMKEMAKNSFNKTEIIESKEMLKGQHEFADFANRDIGKANTYLDKSTWTPKGMPGAATAAPQYTVPSSGYQPMAQNMAAQTATPEMIAGRMGAPQTSMPANIGFGPNQIQPLSTEGLSVGMSRAPQSMVPTPAPYNPAGNIGIQAPNYIDPSLVGMESAGISSAGAGAPAAGGLMKGTGLFGKAGGFMSGQGALSKLGMFGAEGVGLLGKEAGFLSGEGALSTINPFANIGTGTGLFGKSGGFMSGFGAGSAAPTVGVGASAPAALAGEGAAMMGGGASGLGAGAGLGGLGAGLTAALPIVGGLALLGEVFDWW